MELGRLVVEHPFCNNCPFVDPKVERICSGGVPIEVSVICSNASLCKEKIKQGMEANHDTRNIR